MIGTCTLTTVAYRGGKAEVQEEHRPWAAGQQFRNESERASWCSPFAGLYSAMEHSLARGQMLSTSLQQPGAESEAKTQEGLLCGHVRVCVCACVRVSE